MYTCAVVMHDMLKQTNYQQVRMEVRAQFLPS